MVILIISTTNMKIAFFLFTLGLWLTCSACQSSRFGSSVVGGVGGGSVMDDNATGIGHDESAAMDYPEKLADPGPF